jgi:hypothetical protein
MYSVFEEIEKMAIPYHENTGGILKGDQTSGQDSLPYVASDLNVPKEFGFSLRARNNKIGLYISSLQLIQE